MNTTPRKKPHKKPPLPLKKPKITFWDSMLPEDSKEEAVALTVMQELTSRELGDEGVEAEKEILEVLKLHLNDYKKIPENEQDPEFKKNLEKDITIFQNYVNNQSGGKRRKKKTRKKRGGMRYLEMIQQIINNNINIQLQGDEINLLNKKFNDLHNRVLKTENLYSAGPTGGRRKKKTRKKRGGLDSFPIGMLDQLSQDTVYNNPHKDDLIRRLNHIWNILGEDEEDEDAQEAFKDLIRRNPNSFYPLIIHFIQQAEAEHHGGRRKKKTRKKRGGMDEQPTPPQVPRDNDVGTIQYEPGQLGVQQPPQIPPFVLPPPANTEPVVRNRRAAIRMEGAPPDMIRSADERAMLVNRANERFRRSYLRNLSGDLLERCTGSRCGLGGRRRKKKTRRKRGGMEALRKRINKSAKKIDKNRQNLSNPEIRTSPITLPFIRPLTKSQSNFEEALNRPISPIVSNNRKGGKRIKKKTRKKKNKKRRTKKKSRKR